MVFEKYRLEIVRELKKLLEGDSPLLSMLKYHMGWVNEEGVALPQEYSGKLLRPAFCLMSCEAVGGDWRVAVPAAASIEFIHNFSLIHDDIEDCSAYRRHRRTLWSLWGEPRAINAGDTMHTIASLAMLRLNRDRVSPEHILEALTISNETCLRLCEGQHLDLSYENRLDIRVEDYMKMIAGKTAALFECSFRLGAMLGTENKTIIGKFRSCGHFLGLAFQIKDDILGIWGGEEAGKSTESDLRKKKKTLPVVYALGQAEIQDREFLMGFYQKQEPSSADILEAKQVLERAGAREYAKKVAVAYYLKALDQLDIAGLSGLALESLKQAASSVVEREF